MTSLTSALNRPEFRKYLMRSIKGDNRQYLYLMESADMDPAKSIIGNR